MPQGEEMSQDSSGRIVCFHELGGPEALRIEAAPPRAPRPDEALIRIRAMALNRADAMFRRGTYLEKPVLPARSGFEAAGVVETVGADVSGFAPGDRVNVIPGASVGRHGTCADWLTIPARYLVHQPAGLSDEQAAALWMGYVTAYGALIEVCGLQPGQWVVITAASSSVGLLAIQIARAAGARPIATILGEGLRPAMLEAGAEAVIVADQEDMAARLAEIAGDPASGGGIHAAFDAVGGPQVVALAEAMRPHGVVVVHGALSPEPTPFPLKLALRKSLSFRGYIYTEVIETPAAMSRAQSFLQRGIADGFIAPRIDSRYALDDIVAAHRHLESGRAFGKIVILP